MIISPGYPDDYANNLHCTYTINAQPQDFIRLQFRPDFHVEGGANKAPIVSPEHASNSTAPKPPSRPPRSRRTLFIPHRIPIHEDDYDDYYFEEYIDPEPEILPQLPVRPLTLGKVLRMEKL